MLLMFLTTMTWKKMQKLFMKMQGLLTPPVFQLYENNTPLSKRIRYNPFLSRTGIKIFSSGWLEKHCVSFCYRFQDSMIVSSLLNTIHSRIQIFSLKNVSFRGINLYQLGPLSLVKECWNIFIVILCHLSFAPFPHLYPSTEGCEFWPPAWSSHPWHWRVLQLPGGNRICWHWGRLPALSGTISRACLERC